MTWGIEEAPEIETPQGAPGKARHSCNILQIHYYQHLSAATELCEGADSVTQKLVCVWLFGRQDALPVLLAEFREYLDQNRRRFSAKSKMTYAINYMLDRWDGLTRFMTDGRIELDTNIVERTIRPIALSRKNCLFAGSDLGADNWAVIASLLETAKLNSVDPFAWLSTILTKLANGHGNKDLDALMPWNFMTAD